MVTRAQVRIDIDASRAKRGAEETKRALDGVSDSARQTDRAISQTEEAIDGVGRRSRSAGRQMGQAFRSARSEVERTARSTRGAVSGVRQVEASVRQLGATSRSAGSALSGIFAGLAVGAVVREAVSAISDFELSIARVTAVTRANEETQRRFIETARDLGASTRFSASEAADGLLFLSRAGFTAEEAITSLPATLNLAAAGEVELGRAADIASNALTQFGLSAGETERAVDTLLITSNRSNTDIEQLAQALNFAGSTAGAFGLNIEETAASLGVLGNAGIQATIAGTNLRGILAALVGPTDKAQKALARLNIDVSSVNPGVSSLSEIFRRFSESGLGAADALDIFGRRNVAAALQLTRNVDEVERLTRANSEFRGEAERSAATINDTLSGAFAQFRSRLEELALATGDQGLGASLRGIVEFGTQVVERLTLGVGATGEFSVAVNAAAIAVQALVVALGLLLVVQVGTFFASAGRAVLGLVAALRQIPTVLAAIRLALATNPIGLIAVAATALVVPLLEATGLLSDFARSQDEAAESAIRLADAESRVAEEVRRASVERNPNTRLGRGIDAAGNAVEIEILTDPTDRGLLDLGSRLDEINERAKSVGESFSLQDEVQLATERVALLRSGVRAGAAYRSRMAEQVSAPVGRSVRRRPEGLADASECGAL